MKKKFPLPLFITFSVCIFLLWVLGTWQLNKNFIVNKNKQSFKNTDQANPIKLLSLPDKIDDLTYVEFAKVKVTNNFLYLEPRTFKGKIGYHVIRVVKVDGKNLLVNKGFTSSKDFSNNHFNKYKVIEGYIIKVPEPKFFELKNDEINKVWYTLKLDDLEKEFDLKLSPYILYQQRYDEDNKLKPVIPNLVSNVNHLNYAMTWYLLSFALFIVFFVFFKKNYKKYD